MHDTMTLFYENTVQEDLLLLVIINCSVSFLILLFQSCQGQSHHPSEKETSPRFSFGELIKGACVIGDKTGSVLLFYWLLMSCKNN